MPAPGKTEGIRQASLKQSPVLQETERWLGWSPGW